MANGRRLGSCGPLWEMAMTDALEEKLIKALQHVDAHGDVAPYDVHDPMTMLMREKAVQTNLVRWDDVHECYVLTSAGQGRISARTQDPGAVISFKKRHVMRHRARQQQLTKTNIDE